MAFKFIDWCLILKFLTDDQLQKVTKIVIQICLARYVIHKLWAMNKE